MINFKAIEKLSENEFLVIMDSLNGLIYTEETAVKDQIITEVSDNIALNGADKRFEIDSSKLIEKLKTFTEDDSKRLAKYVEFLFEIDDLPLNFGIHAESGKTLNDNIRADS